MWADRRASDSPHVEFLTERRLPEGLKAAQGKFSLAIIDTPPAAGSQALMAAEAADLVLIPCRPSLIDLDAIRRTAHLTKSTGKPAFVVFNAAPHSATTLLEDARAIVQDVGFAACPVILRERSTYRACWPLGTAVKEAQPTSKAAHEISALTDWVLSELMLQAQAQTAEEPEVAVNG
jgi:chromosome partitioning protein